ncbi:MAG: hypothetical protein ACREVG_01930 [Burkholderiales bacterium]
MAGSPRPDRSALEECRPDRESAEDRAEGPLQYYGSERRTEVDASWGWIWDSRITWKKHRPDFEVHSVEVLKSEPKQYQERRWINYKLAITATGTDKGSREMHQKKYRCTPEDYSSVLKMEGGNWVADDKMIKIVNESRDCALAK